MSRSSSAVRFAVLAAALALIAFAPAEAGAVVGGSTIQVQAAPWTVFVQQTSGSTRFLCTGSVVDASHILTAAHCLYDTNNNLAAPSAFQVRAGISNFSAPLSTDLEQDRAVSQVRVHPGFTYTGKANPDDVAVLVLATPLDLSGPAVRAVALPAPNAPFPAGASVTIAGFGKQTPTAASSGQLSSLTGTIDPQGNCGDPASDGLISFNAIELCEASPSSAICNGDSGGGLVTGSAPTLIGVVSAGAPGCDIGSHTLFTYTGAAEILAFIQGNDQPPTAPREGTNGVVERWRAPLVVGNTIECDPGDWGTSNATYAFSFVNEANGQVFQHGAATTFRIPALDAGATIQCVVAATNAGGTSLDETTATDPIKGPPQARIAHISPLALKPGGAALLRVTLVAPAGLYGKFSVCITPPKSVAGRLCRSTTNDDGGADSVPFIFRFHVKQTAKPGTATLGISAVAGLSSATSSAVLRVS